MIQNQKTMLDLVQFQKATDLILSLKTLLALTQNHKKAADLMLINKIILVLLPLKQMIEIGMRLIQMLLLPLDLKKKIKIMLTFHHFRHKIRGMLTM